MSLHLLTLLSLFLQNNREKIINPLNCHCQWGRGGGLLPCDLIIQFLKSLWSDTPMDKQITCYFLLMNLLILKIVYFVWTYFPILFQFSHLSLSLLSNFLSIYLLSICPSIYIFGY